MSRTPRQAKTCQKCGEVKPWSDFFASTPESKRRHRVGRYCKECRSNYYDLWDFAAALCKSTAMHVARSRGADGEWTQQVDANAVRALMQLQGGRCALTRLRFTCPNDYEALPKGSTLEAWAEGQVLDDRQMHTLPVLVRASHAVGWVSGNVLLIARMVEPVYRHCDGIVGAAEFMRQTQTPAIPTLSAISERRAIIDTEMKRIWLEEYQRNKEIEKELTNGKTKG